MVAGRGLISPAQQHTMVAVMLRGRSKNSEAVSEADVVFNKAERVGVGDAGRQRGGVTCSGEHIQHSRNRLVGYLK
jgi:nitrogenase subunit NifH